MTTCPGLFSFRKRVPRCTTIQDDDPRCDPSAGRRPSGRSRSTTATRCLATIRSPAPASGSTTIRRYAMPHSAVAARSSRKGSRNLAQRGDYSTPTRSRSLILSTCRCSLRFPIITPAHLTFGTCSGIGRNLGAMATPGFCGGTTWSPWACFPCIRRESCPAW